MRHIGSGAFVFVERVYLSRRVSPNFTATLYACILTLQAKKVCFNKFVHSLGVVGL